MWIRSILLAAAVLLSADCTPPAKTAAAAARQDRNLLTAENLREFRGRNLYEVIRQVRPHWLTTRGPVSLRNPGAAEIIVYRDSQKLGGLSYLNEISVETVVSAHFLTGPEATTRYGLDHPHGAIVVITRR